MSTKYVQPGNFIDVVLTGTVASNDVDVVGTGQIGVATKSGVSGESISYGVKEVWKLPKVSGAVIAQGERVLWDASAGAVDDDLAIPAAGDFICGRATEAAGAGVLEIAVDINVLTGAVT